VYLPVDAIYPENQLPQNQERHLKLNAELAREWPVIDVKKDPPPDAENGAKVEDKLQYLER
jgi:ferredoxin